LIEWTHAVDAPPVSTILSLDWSVDGTLLSVGGSNGQVTILSSVEHRMEWRHYEMIFMGSKLVINDILNGHSDTLDLKSRIIKASIGFGHLIALTSTQCYLYSLKNLNTPSIVDLTKNGHIRFILQTAGYKFNRIF
jgi:intraflagellar transport protein 80